MIVFLVEGAGDESALLIMFRRLWGSSFAVRCVDMGGKSHIVRLHNGFEKTILRQAIEGITHFVVLLDRDVTFPPYQTLVEEEREMLRRARALSAEQQLHVNVFWAVREFESWLVGGLRRNDEFCGLRRITRPITGDTQAHPEDPKKWIKEHRIENRYSEAIQACLAKHIDWHLARRRNKSLRDFLDGVDRMRSLHETQS